MVDVVIREELLVAMGLNCQEWKLHHGTLTIRPTLGVTVLKRTHWQR